MKENTKFNYDQFKEFLRREVPEEESLRAFEWFGSHSSDVKTENILHDFWEELPTGHATEEFDSERIHDRIHHQVRIDEFSEYEKNRKRGRFITYLTRIAAVLVLPLALFIVLNSVKERQESNKPLSTAKIYSPHGARTRFLLPDGSSGWLNGNSYLTFPTEFNGKSREVQLIGEGYFNVSKNPEMPFVVDSKAMKVIAYGTSFNVSAYPDDQNIGVTLESGDVELVSIDVEGKDHSIGRLRPGNKCVYSRITNLYSIAQVNVSENTSWKEGMLVFRNDPMPEVVKRINRWYNANLILKDTRLETYNYRATFVDETLDEVLKLLTMTSPIQYREMGREILPDGTYGKRTIELLYSHSIK